MRMHTQDWAPTHTYLSAGEMQASLVELWSDFTHWPKFHASFFLGRDSSDEPVPNIAQFSMVSCILQNLGWEVALLELL